MINKKPYIEVADSQGRCWEGWNHIGSALKDHIGSLNSKKIIIAIESNLGTHLESNLHSIREVLSPNVTCLANSIYKDENQILQLLKRGDDLDQFSMTVTTDIESYFDSQRLEGLRSNIDFIDEGIILIHGTGASLIWDADILIYSDISRWEQLQRFRRNEISNIGVDTKNLPYELKEKWSYFTDWRVCDKIKKKIIKTCDYFIETNNWEKPKMATGDIIRKGYKQIYMRPFFNAPFYDPGLWVPSEVTEDVPFEWTFNCNMDKNNVLLKLDEHLFETPAINLIYYNPSEILGPSVYRRYGLEMPIRFNFLDSLDEKDYNIYAYPNVEYLKDNYGITYQQHDNYYVMESQKGSSIGLGLKSDTSAEFMEEASLNASTKRDKNAVLSGLNTIALKKHDHLVISNDLMHTRGDKLMILHISTAPSIFELKLFEDHLGDPSRHINRFIELTTSEQVDPTNSLNDFSSADDSSNEEILSPVNNDQYIIRRYWIEKPTIFETSNVIQVLNLIEGDSVNIRGGFEDFTVCHAETFVVPAGVKNYEVVPPQGERIGLLMASVRS